jgi:hypothetical protein
MLPHDLTQSVCECGAVHVQVAVAVLSRRLVSASPATPTTSATPAESPFPADSPATPEAADWEGATSTSRPDDPGDPDDDLPELPADGDDTETVDVEGREARWDAEVSARVVVVVLSRWALRSAPVNSGPLRSTPVHSGQLRSTPVNSGPLRSLARPGQAVQATWARSNAQRCSGWPMHSFTGALLQRVGRVGL